MPRTTYSGYITDLKTNQIFVFGSNPCGRHGRGTARIASTKYGAISGTGHGLQGRSYGLVTKNLSKGCIDAYNVRYEKVGRKSVDPNQIILHIRRLYEDAKIKNDHDFLIAYKADGKNLNGYTSAEMAQMFHNAKPIPKNIIFEDKFLDLILKYGKI